MTGSNIPDAPNTPDAPDAPDNAHGRDPQHPRKAPQSAGSAEQAPEAERFAPADRPAPALQAEQPAQPAPGSADRSPPGGSVPSGSVPPGGAGSGRVRSDALLLDDELGETADEAALRLLMRGAVADLQGSPDALDHLRRAVPARRQRRRQAVVGACAVVLLAAMAVPALLRVTGATGTSDTAATGPASSHTAAPNEDGHASAWGDSGSSAGPVSPGPGGTPTSQHPTVGASSGPANPPVTASGTTLDAPECASSQLGQAISQAAAPDADGRVYGWFRVANVSASACTVPNGGVVQAVAQGAADPAKIQVVEHTEGDASALPTPSITGPVVLNPGDDYEVDFAWVPATDAGAGGCPVTPTDPPTTPTPTDSPSESPATTTGGSDAGTTGNSASPQLGTDDPASPDPGSIALNHTPAAGAPEVAGPVIQSACAGTVYTTSAIPEPAATPAS